MIDAVFVDTNVLVYARDASESAKQARAAEWMQRLWQERRGRISMQVLQEYYVTVTQKLKPGLSPLSARADVRALMSWEPIEAGDLMPRAWHVQDTYKLSFCDSLIVAAAQVADATVLLTEDLSDGQMYGDVRVVNPFVHDPYSL